MTNKKWESFLQFMKSKRHILAPARILALVAVITTAVLAAVHMMTEDRIEEMNRKAADEARQRVLAAAGYQEHSLEADGREVVYYAAVDADGMTIGYVFTAVTTGRSAGLTVMTGMDLTGRVTGVAVVQDNETAGYVDKVSGLLDRLRGRNAGDAFSLGEDVDGVSQATKTSEGVVAGVRMAAGWFGLAAKEAE